MRFTVDRLDHLVLTCADVEITAAWYERVLGMERNEQGPDRRCALLFGGQTLIARPADAAHWPSAREARPGAADLCFVTAVGPEDVVGHLHSCGVAVERGPVRKEGALGEIASIFCRDPDGNLIEIASYLT